MRQRDLPFDGGRASRRAWLQVTIAGGALMTAVDAVLLQQRKAFFTGGFLSTAHTDGIADALGFLLISFFADAAIVGVLAAAALAVVGRIRLTAHARVLATFLASVSPLLVANFITYRLASYLGDRFDLALLFDLTDRKPQELAAVASPHLIFPVLLIGTAGGAAGGLVWLVNRLAGQARSTARLGLRLVLVTIALAIAGVSTAAAVRTWNETYDDGLGRKPSGRVAMWIAQMATDVDRDGFGVGGAASDPDPFDGSVYPYAVDVPGNGVDEDGIGGDLPADGQEYKEDAPPQPWQRKPNVVLFVLESFRADALGHTVGGRSATPVLDALGRSGIFTTNALSHNGYTAQSRFHIFSGSLANLRGGTTLIDDFKANGYEVAYFSGQDDSFGGDAYAVGMDRADVAYDARQDRRRRYSNFTTAGSLAVPFEVVQERIAAFLERRDNGRPLFLYVNFHETHYPYHRAGLRNVLTDRVLAEPQIAPSRSDALREMYFNTAANVDSAVGATLDLVSRRLGGPPAVVVTADHGESLFDEGFLGHGYALNDVQTRIPLVVSGLPLIVEEPFGQADLRNALARALAAPPSGSAPALVRARDKKVFQYLGRIERPRQIAFTSAASRTIYDFRTNRVQFTGGGPWKHPDTLTNDESAALRDLVQTWERMILARAGTPQPRP